MRVQDYDKENSKINSTLLKSAHNGEDIQRGTPKNIYSYRDVTINNRAKYILDTIILENKRLASWNCKNIKIEAIFLQIALATLLIFNISIVN